MDPTDLTVRDASAELATGRITATALTEAYLRRIEQHDGALNCFVTVTADLAVAQAAEADRRRQSGGVLSPLDGIPIALKDNIDVEGLPTTNGLASGPIAQCDAEAARRLREAGAVFLGKLNMHEGALGATTDNVHHGRAHNPWRHGFTPGGSSGGSGAAVAARLCAAAIGTDTMGSVRIPAAYCGVTGLLPTTGLVSTRGVAPLSFTLDHVGPIARTVGDLAVLLDAMAGFDPDQPGSAETPDTSVTGTPEPAPLDKLRVGLLENFSAVDSDPDVGKATETVQEMLGEAGASLVVVSIPDYDPSAARRAGLLLSEAEATVALEADIAERPGDFSPDFLAMLAYGRDAGAGRVVKAMRCVKHAGQSLRNLLRKVDVVVSPTAPQVAFPFHDETPDNQADLTALANFAGCPAVSIPCGLSSTGLPIGLQIIGPPFAEARLLSLALALEAQIGFEPLSSVSDR